MGHAHQKPKAPEKVKRRLMDEAIGMAVAQGLSAITVQSVAAAAEVSKGGFLHHFPTKQHLIDAIFDEVIDHLAIAIDARVKKDAVPYGRFTRAYLDIALGGERSAMGQTWIALSILMLDQAALRAKWANWFVQQLTLHGEDPKDTKLATVRLAVDGAWVSDYSGIPLPDRKDLFHDLKRQTSPPKSARQDG